MVAEVRALSWLALRKGLMSEDCYKMIKTDSCLAHMLAV